MSTIMFSPNTWSEITNTDTNININTGLVMTQCIRKIKKYTTFSHKYIVEQEMLSYAACIYGQSLIENTQGKNSIRRKAMEQFLASAG